MKIIGSQTSPFTRVVRIACEELNLHYDFDVTVTFTKMTPEQEAAVRQHNPLMKVPVLVDGDTDIVDSRIILQHILRKHPKPGFGPKSAADENILSVIYGALDAGVLMFLTKMTHPELEMDKGYMARSKKRIGESLIWLEQQPGLGKEFGVAEALLLSMLEWFRKRDVFAWDSYPNIVSIHTKFHERPSMVKTRIPETA